MISVHSYTVSGLMNSVTSKIVKLMLTTVSIETIYQGGSAEHWLPNKGSCVLPRYALLECASGSEGRGNVDH